MHTTWIDTIVTAPAAPPTPAVDDLLRVYLGQSRGSRAPEPTHRVVSVETLELWDYLGDFA